MYCTLQEDYTIIIIIIIIIIVVFPFHGCITIFLTKNEGPNIEEIVY